MDDHEVRDQVRSPSTGSLSPDGAQRAAAVGGADTPATAVTGAGRPGPGGSWWRRLLAQRSVQVVIWLWVLGNALIFALAGGHLPFHRPSVHDQPVGQQVVTANLALVEVLLLIALVYWLTRRRDVPDLAARAPARDVAMRETLGLVGYGVLGLLGGYVLGRVTGWHPVSFHIDGTLYGTDDHVSRGEVFGWAAYNFVWYAVLPFAYFRRRYSTLQLGLRSTDRRGDLLVIVVVLVVESVVEFLGLSAALFDLSPRQALLGMPLTFALYLVGTVLPTMVFIYCVLLPRYRLLTGSTATTVILGGVTYTLLHVFDGWLAYDTLSTATLSVIFLFLQYFGPGMIKSVLTLRTGNAWVHVWAYHAIAPHTIADTPFMVKVFGI
jgi:hypothetical protein